MFRDLGNQSECLAGALKREEHDRLGGNIVGLETAVSHRERSRLRPICCGVNDLVTALCPITNRGKDIAAWKQPPRTSLIINFLRVVIAEKPRTWSLNCKTQPHWISARTLHHLLEKTFREIIFFFLLFIDHNGRIDAICNQRTKRSSRIKCIFPFRISKI